MAYPPLTSSFLAPQSPPNLAIFTTLRSDALLLTHPLNRFSPTSPSPPSPSQFYLLSYHRDRLLCAAQQFNFQPAIKLLSTPSSLSTLQSALEQHLLHTYSSRTHPSPVRIRMTVSSDGAITLTSAPTPALPLSAFFPLSLSPFPDPATAAWRIRLSLTAVIPSPYTVHKTTKREMYDTARGLLSATATDVEVLVVNERGEVMEGSLTTPYFWREGSWVTPREECGGNRGTTRRWALERGVAVEGVVRAEEVQVGEVVWLSNGVRGFGWGMVQEVGREE
ncbi:hypothetical protein MMC26_002024 [Xylographa opegraphella]|nr:hypothetical protein [Xylographa opegraphella]